MRVNILLHGTLSTGHPCLCGSDDRWMIYRIVAATW